MMESTNLFVLTAILLAGVITDSEALEIECQDVSLERGSIATVSCKFDLNFIAVFWYKGEANNPFLRLEERRPTVEEGFQITSDGAMIIDNVQVKHEGIYKISVLDADGVSNSENMLISVKVTLLEEPVLKICSSYESQACSGAGDGESVLICETKETRPAVFFVWTELSSNQPVEIDSSFHTSVMNETTGLYHSYATIHFNRKEFTLQLFTCKAIGDAVNVSKSSSMFLKGFKNVKTREETLKMVKQGSPLRIRCPKEESVLGVLNVTYMNGTVRTLTTIYPGDHGALCELGTRCTVLKNGDTMISDLTFKDEGTYACISSDGKNVRKHLTVVNIMITPKSDGVIFDECENSSRCERNVDLRGTLLSSVVEARPRVKILCEVPKNSDSVAFIFNERTTFEEHKGEGTFDTHYTIEYKIPECSNSVHVQCYVSPDSVHKGIAAANVYLITDTSACHKGNPGIIVLMVVLFAILFVAVLIGLICRKKVLKQLSGHGKKEIVGSDQTYLSINSPSPDPTQAVPLLEQDKQEFNIKTQDDTTQEKLNSDKKKSLLEHQWEKSSDLIDSTQNAFREKIKPFIDKIIQKEGDVGEFNTILETFSEEHEVKELVSVLLNFLKKSEHDDKDLAAIVEFLDVNKPNQWVSFFDFMKILDELTKSKKLSGDRTLQYFEEYTKSNQINLATFVNLTGSLLTSHFITLQSLQRAFRSIVETKGQDPSTFAEAFLDYHLLGYISQDDAVKEIVSFAHSSTIPLHCFFQSTFLQYGKKSKVQHQPKLFEIFKKILALMNMNEGDRVEKLFQGRSDHKIIKKSTVSDPIHQFMVDNKEFKGQDLGSIFIEVLICSVETESDYATCKEILQSAQESGRLTPSNFVDAFSSCILQKLITEDFQENMLYYILSQKMVTDKENSCFQALLEVNDLQSFFSCLHKCYKTELISEEYFVCLVVENIKNGKIVKGDYNQVLEELCNSGKMTKQEADNLTKEVLKAAKKDHELKTSFKLFPPHRSFPKASKKS